MISSGTETCSELTQLVAERGRRELAAREGDGLQVQLLWDPTADAVTGGDRFHLAVDRERALEAFYHPFAYAA